MDPNAVCLYLPNNLKVEYIKAKGYISMPAIHYHENYEIYYQLSGARNYLIKDRKYKISKGDMVLIKPFELHRTTTDITSDCERIIVYVKNDLFSAYDSNILNIKLLACFNSNIDVLRLDREEQRFIEQILLKMLHESTKKEKWSDSYIKSMLVELLIFINKHTEEKYTEVFDCVNESSKMTNSIIRYISENYMYNLTLTSIARNYFMAPNYIARLFKNDTKYTCIEFLNNVRIKEACKLLTESKLKVQEVSEKVGYDSITHFDRTFKKICGCSPLKYRRNHLDVL